MPEKIILHIEAIEPTIFFIKKNELRQIVNISIENVSDEAEAIMDVVWTDSFTFPAGKIERGRKTYQIYIPDIRETTPVKFILKANGEVQDQYTMNWKPAKHWQVFMIPISHHDLGYTDTIENVLHKYNGFYENILRFCEETDDWQEESKFRYMVEEAWSIQHFIESSSDEVIDKLAKYIREGRIEIPALFGNEISAMCSHEELIRLMYPSFRIKRKYGAPLQVGSITDIPGLCWGLPTVLSGAGIKYFFAGLPTYFQWGRNDIHTFWDESRILREHGKPDAFYWQGPDGEKILVYYQGSYGCWSPSSYEEAYDQLPGMLAEMEKRGCPFSVMRYGGYGCGDNTPPDIRVSHIVREWNSKWAYPKLTVGTSSLFFSELEKQCHDIRTFRGELPHTDYAVGAVSTARETTINRLTHDKLHSAEKFAAIASLLDGYSYPAERIRDAYNNMLLYDEHTWGMAHQIGQVQDWAWNEKSHYAYKSAGLTEQILSGSTSRIANSISFENEGRHIVVLNSLSFQRTDIVNIPNFLIEEPFDLVDEETGKTIPYQVVELNNPQAPIPYAAQRYARGLFNRPELFDLAFVAENVPPIGYKSYRIVPKEFTMFGTGVMVGEASLENRFFKITLNPQTGTVESIYDKELSRELVDKDAPHQVNQLITRWVKSGKKESPEKAFIQKNQDGAVYGSLIVSSQCAGCPQITQEIILYDKVKRIDFANRVLKDSTPAMEVYFAFPFMMENPDFRFEGSNSVIKPLRDQFPGSNSNYYTVQHWADVSDGAAGVTFSPVESHLVEFGGLHPCYVSQAHHGVTPPDFGAEFVSEMTKGHIYSYVLDSNFRTNFQPNQQGDILFRYSITTHKGGWKEGQPRNFGWGIGNPLISAHVSGKREGRLPGTMSFCQVDKPNVLLLTLKKAEDGDGTIIRLIETEGEDTVVNINLPFMAIEKVQQTNLVEENMETLSVSGNTIKTPVRAFGIKTLRVITKPMPG